METEIFWEAIKNNDARFNGAFFYGVNSTKIYCKPSCAARLPRRDNVRFFASVERAEKEGFRACRRCRPQSEKANPQTCAVLRACEMLAQGETVSLEDLGAELNLSPTHLQRIFKEIVGVSPKKYSAAKRLEKFKNELKRGADVAGALYEAGYGSSSRLYENVSAKLGMTPKKYARGGENVRIDYAVVDCELGKMLVARTEKGVCAVAFGDDERVLTENLGKEYPRAEMRRDENNLKDYVEAIIANLDGTNKSLDLPLDLRATAFQMRVWEILRRIPYGETVSYRQVAEQLGNSKAVRAVASACASNRVALVIPCHRVVREGGDLSGYRWGVERKKRILEKEKQASGAAPVDKKISAANGSETV